MKKTFRLIINTLFILSYYVISAQLDNNSQKKNIVALPTSANAYALDKVGKLSVDMFRGKANINIIFHTISVDGVNIPISLSYNTGGIKLNEVASTVGLGWALNIPSSINQNIIDKDDKYFSMYTKDINNVFANIRTVEMYDNDIRQMIDDHYEGVYDTRPDLFNYSLPFGGGSFIFNNNTGNTIPHEDLLITAINNKRNIQVINTDGSTYFLSLKNSTLLNSGVPGDTGSGSETLYQLDSIKTNNNRKILFEYGKQYSYQEKTIIEKANIDISTGLDPMADLPTSLPDYERYTGTVVNMEKLITKITFPDGIIYFNYSNDGLPFTDESNFRKDLSGSNGVALRQILVKDNNGKVIKNYNLNFSYFTSNTNNDFQNYRLKLENIYDNLQNNYHKFYYNETVPFPARNSNNDDYWGYINSTIYQENSANLPDKIYTDYTGENITIPSQYTRNKNTNPDYTKIGILNKIVYPTGGSKHLYYENATKYFTRTDYEWGYTDNFTNVLTAPSGGISDGFGNVNQTVTIPSSFFDGKESPKIKLSFGNTCENNMDDETSQIHDTSCYGNAIVEGMHYGTNGKPASFELNNISSPINISLSRVGKCTCGYSIDAVYGKYNTVNTNMPIGGLRIKKIEDQSENNFINTYNYKYETLDLVTNTTKSSGILNIPFQYTSLLKRYITLASDGTELYGPAIQKYLVVNNSSANYNAYGSSDVITYKQVAEYNELGENINIFSQVNNSDSDRMYTHIYSNYNDWKNGLLEKNIILNKQGDTLKVQKNKYAFNYLKNPKAGFITSGSDQIGFALNLDIAKFPRRVTGSLSDEHGQSIYVQLYAVNKEIIGINSGKIETTESKTTEYFPNHTLVSKTANTYYDTDINKPINLKSTENTLPSGEKVKTTYSYAHEKGNQLMIDKNMIGIPLETTTTQTIGTTTKTLSRAETIYPLNQSEANTKSSGLVLPLSVISYDNLNASPSTEVKYDKYDEKGNILQYTTKEGIPVAILWGYNTTQPIAKIEGITYDQLLATNSVAAVVSKSNEDAADPTKEGLFLDALNDFRKQSAFAGKQVSTFTYDPLIGVTSITPPSGIREVYVYDTANRLKEVKVREKDTAGNYVFKKVKEYNYNYKQ